MSRLFFVLMAFAAPPHQALDTRASAPALVSLAPIDFAKLRSLHSECRDETRLATLPCAAAIESACVERGFATGTGPLATRDGRIEVACFKENVARSVVESSEEILRCTDGRDTPAGCRSIVHRLCVKRGYLSGFGPTQVHGREARVGCVTKDHGATRDFYDDRFTTVGLDVELGFGSPARLAVAAHRLCLDEGFVTGFGPIEMDATRAHGRVFCVGKSRRNEADVSKLAHFWKALDDKPAEPDEKRIGYFGCDGCGLNATRFTRPTPDGYAFDRHANTNAGDVFSLGLAQWDGRGLPKHVKRLVDTARDGIAIDGAHVYNAYDPSTVSFRGETWVAFECSGKGLGLSAGVCMGKFTNGTLDPKSAYVLVHTNETPGTLMYSASVPKLARHRGRLYLYWSQQKLEKGPFPQKLVSIQTKAVELFLDGRGRPLNKEGRPFHADDGVVVAAGTDAFDVVSDGEHLYMLGGSVPPGCDTPGSPVVGCYDMIALRAKEPLGEFSEKKKVFAWPQAHEYGTFFFGEDGKRLGVGAQFIKTEKNPGKLPPVMRVVDFTRP